MAFCYLRVVGRGFARVILPELILDRSEQPFTVSEYFYPYQLSLLSVNFSDRTAVLTRNTVPRQRLFLPEAFFLSSENLYFR